MRYSSRSPLAVIIPLFVCTASLALCGRAGAQFIYQHDNGSARTYFNNSIDSKSQDNWVAKAFGAVEGGTRIKSLLFRAGASYVTGQPQGLNASTMPNAYVTAALYLVTKESELVLMTSSVNTIPLNATTDSWVEVPLATPQYLRPGQIFAIALLIRDVPANVYPFTEDTSNDGSNSYWDIGSPPGSIFTYNLAKPNHLVKNGDTYPGFPAGTTNAYPGKTLLRCNADDERPIVETWVSRYRDPNSFDPGDVNATFARAMALDSSGNVFIAGTTISGYLTAKYNPATGEELWEARTQTGGGYWEGTKAIALDAAGNVYVTGLTGPDYDETLATIKYSGATGKQLWIANYPGPSGSSTNHMGIALDAAGNVYITGPSRSPTAPGNEDFATIKYDGGTGAQIWTARYTTENWGVSPGGISVSPAGIFVTGTVTGTDGNWNATTIKYDASTGAQIWVAQLFQASSNAVTSDSAGNVYVTGSNTIKYDGTSGTELWRSSFGGQGNAIAVDHAGNIVATGQTGFDSGSIAAGTVKYDAATGSPFWSATGGYGGANALALDAAGNVYVAGVAGNPNGESAYHTLVYDGLTGVARWDKTYSFAIGGYNIPNAIAVDGAGNVYVTGYSGEPNANGLGFAPDAVTVRYAPAALAPLAFQTGDVFVAVDGGRAQWHNPAGALYASLDTFKGEYTYTTGMAFDAAGILYVTDFNANAITRFDGGGAFLGDFGGGFGSDPESVLFDAKGNAYVGQADGTARVLKFDPFGNPLAAYTVVRQDRGSDWIELAADQRTLYYTSESSAIKRFDLVANTQLPDFLPSGTLGESYALRLLPGGGLIVANWRDIRHFDSAGHLIRTYAVTGEGSWFAMNLDPDGRSFWSAGLCSGNVYKFDIATGAVLAHFQAGHSIGGLTVKGELTVGGLQPTNTAPIAKCQNVTVEAGAGSCYAAVSASQVNNGSYDPDAGDSISMTPSPTGPFPVGTTNVTLTITDSHGASDSCTATITVLDKEPPVISCPKDVSVPNDPKMCSAKIDPGKATASDNCSGVSVSGVRSDGLALTDAYPVGTTTISWTAMDASLNTASCSQTITVTDKESPVIACPKDVQVANDAGLCSAKLDPGKATATDNCKVASINGVRSDGMQLTDPYPVGKTVITWAAMDASGNPAACSQTVTVLDKEPPVIKCPADKTVDQDSPYGATVSFTTGASDNCSSVKVSSTPPSGSIFPVGTTTLNCTATDAAGNTSSCSFKVTVRPPVSSAAGAKVTGNGGIAVNRGVGTFVFDIQVQVPGVLVGSLSYTDPKAGATIQMTSLTSLVVSGTHGRFFGKCTVNGAGSFDFMVDVDDLGETGVGYDKFSIQVSNGYKASGVLVSGNIQVHKP